MEIRPTLKAGQKHSLTLTSQVRQALHILSLPTAELRALAAQSLVENALLRQASPSGDREEELSRKGSDVGKTVLHEEHGERPLRIVLRIGSGPRTAGSQGRGQALDWVAAAEPDFEAMLQEQIRFMPLEHRLSSLCISLIACLNTRGYLDRHLAELARDFHASSGEMKRALRVVQSLEPAGVGARNLTECLLLQLKAKGLHGRHTVKLVREGLPLLAGNDLRAICSLLGCDRSEAMKAGEAIRSLEPIPSRGFKMREEPVFVVPEADVRYANGEYVIELNGQALPELEIDEDNRRLLGLSGEEDSVAYLREMLPDARSLIWNIQWRRSTLKNLLKCLVQKQPDYFRHGAELRPMRLADIAECMGVSVSTVSRAVRGKYICCNKGMVELRSLFIRGLDGLDGRTVSILDIKQRIMALVGEEDQAHPLSDEKIRQVLLRVGIPLSRRVVAKYRAELGLASSRGRRASMGG